MPKFIVFEGVDGSGKSTLSKALFDHLHAKKIPVILLATPTPLLRSRMAEDPRKTKLDYYIQDNFEIGKMAQDLIAKGYNVISDRYYFTTMAYQRDDMATNAKTYKACPQPDHVFLAQVSEEERIARIHTREATDAAEVDTSYQQMVAQKYRDLVEPYGFHVIDTSKSIDDCLYEITQVVGL
jgi:dTMP kinase